MSRNPIASGSKRGGALIGGGALKGEFTVGVGRSARLGGQMSPKLKTDPGSSTNTNSCG